MGHTAPSVGECPAEACTYRSQASLPYRPSNSEGLLRNGGPLPCRGPYSFSSAQEITTLTPSCTAGLARVCVFLTTALGTPASDASHRKAVSCPKEWRRPFLSG